MPSSSRTLANSAGELLAIPGTKFCKAVEKKKNLG
jgi:hypothetical protein